MLIWGKGINHKITIHSANYMQIIETLNELNNH